MLFSTTKWSRWLLRAFLHLIFCVCELLFFSISSKETIQSFTIFLKFFVSFSLWFEYKIVQFGCKIRGDASSSFLGNLGDFSSPPCPVPGSRRVLVLVDVLQLCQVDIGFTWLLNITHCCVQLNQAVASVRHYI